MRAPAIGGVGLVALCFLGSAALRLGADAPALAEEIGALAGGAPTGGADDTCSAPADAEALLAAIRSREEQLDGEAARLAERAQTIAVAEAKLREQLAAFETAQRNLEATLAVADKAAERDIERMTTVYESMKPVDAARILERMDVAFASGLLGRMRPEVAASILAGMTPDSAYALTVTIASRNARVPTE